MQQRTVVSLVGARPQFIKEALIGKLARERHIWRHVLVHSGQHYDANMSDVFFRQLGIASPDYQLGVGSASHGKQTGDVLVRFEELLVAERPDLVLVYGDTNTTLAGALAAAKLRIPLAHVEAGIRQAPKDMPEEINRVLTDHVSQLLFCCSDAAATNLREENIREGVHVVGDVMFDVFKVMKPLFDRGDILNKNGLVPGGFFLATVHRDFNVDHKEPLEEILSGLRRIARRTSLRCVLPLHPRTARKIEEFSLQPLLESLCVTEPLGYVELMSLLLHAAFVVTDSGGLQKEAWFAGRRSLVLMPDTGWRELISCGWNVLCAPAQEEMERRVLDFLSERVSCPEGVYGYGDAAEKIVVAIKKFLTSVSR
ncbi:non-hydrolyzing UDP-N-acetylglucosamine 2-epimerase [Aminiphilus circumscriptus]|uniref:non-hydrolyzing UDP-N-acetylglucosamine 2-epimerase n=1 Tax=Aminiphilus circumscriptus TaxID=290732 RepID=UPI0004785A10|nr:UDP-N-acetylglucosamine 2-epimerase (non-hydrolyzing) [Aminiphilus circumscriptus]